MSNVFVNNAEAFKFHKIITSEFYHLMNITSFKMIDCHSIYPVNVLLYYGTFMYSCL